MRSFTLFLLSCIIFSAFAAPIRDSALRDQVIDEMQEKQEAVNSDEAGDAESKKPVPVPKDDESDEDDEYFYADDEADWDDYYYDYDSEEAKQRQKEEFDRYLQEMTEEMMEDPELRDEILEEIKDTPETERDEEDTALLLIAQRLKDEEIRTRLDEQERQMLERQRQENLKRREEMEGLRHHAGEDPQRKTMKISENIDELRKKRADALRNIDAKHHQAFIEKEMRAELHLRERLAQETDPEKRAFIQKHHEQSKKRLNILLSHEPGHKKQLEEVWNEDGFGGMEFNPKVFFRLHDSNNDGTLDTKEFEAMFYHAALKMHSEENGESDPIAVREEMMRMRQHAMLFMDSNQDGMVSEEEFIAKANSEDFNDDKEWHPVIPEFTEEELDIFQKKLEKVAKPLKNTRIDPAKLHASKEIQASMLERIRNAKLKVLNQKKPENNHIQVVDNRQVKEDETVQQDAVEDQAVDADQANDDGEVEAQNGDDNINNDVEQENEVVEANEQDAQQQVEDEVQAPDVHEDNAQA